MPLPRPQVFPTPKALAEALADTITETLDAARRERGAASLVLAGGSSFTALYQRFETVAFDWTGIHLFFGDERRVGPDSPDSNYRMAVQAWPSSLSNGAIMHRLQGELEDPKRALLAYMDEMANYAGVPNECVFDVVLLGLGPDGHTASLFPASLATIERTGLALAVVPAGLPPLVERLTLTPLTLNRSRAMYVVATGDGKQEIVGKVLADTANEYPVSHIAPAYGPLSFYVDQAAFQNVK